MKSHESSRRQLLELSLGAVAAASLTSLKAYGQGTCKLTPAQMEGPFYPVEEQLDKDADLTMVEGRSGRAEGQVIYINGTVKDEQCRPIQGALVEIWQACITGKYDHPNDPNPARIDPNFQYWGQAISREDGTYLFKTIVPGAYPADPQWMRPPHVHFKVSKLGAFELITQMYFAGNALNGQDRILRALRPQDRERVTVRFAPGGAAHAPGSQVGVFDLTLKLVP